MGRRYSEPTLYRDRQCPHCGYYFTARGLQGHIRFYHEGYEKHQIKKLKRRLFNRVESLRRRGAKVPDFVVGSLGSYSDTTLEELEEVEALLDLYH